MKQRKTTKKNKSKTRPIVVARAGGSRRAGGPRQAPRALLDAGALAHARLLRDPCNAPLAGPVYAGSGTGQYRRYRILIPAEGSSVEGCYVFQLGQNAYWRASHVSGTAGTSYTFSAGNHIFAAGDINSSNSMRCIAGCVKVRYTGAESNRSGTIGLMAAPGPYYAPGNASNIANDQTYTPIVYRTGEVQHEVKFVPNAADEAMTVPWVQGVGGITNDKSTLVVAYRGTPAQTIVFEVTAVYEVETQGSVMGAVSPSSNVTLNQLLRALGPASQWAYSNVIAPTLRAMAGKPGNTMYSAVAAASKAVSLLTI